MKCTLEEEANLLANRPYQPHIAAKIRKCIAEATRASTGSESKHGCYCDLERHMEPDGCVIDEGKPENCIYARGKTCKTQCEYWKPITRENNVSAGLAPDAGLAHPSPADEAVRRDAERYRWLLQECYRWPPAGRVCGREDQAQPVAIWTTFEGDDVDAAIDAAMAQREEV